MAKKQLAYYMLSSGFLSACELTLRMYCVPNFMAYVFYILMSAQPQSMKATGKAWAACKCSVRQPEICVAAAAN